MSAKTRVEGEAGPPRHEPAPTGYLHWSRDPAVGLFAVLPLWLLYEGARLALAPKERNGAEALVADTLDAFGPGALTVLRALFGAAVLVAAISIHVRGLPWGKVSLVSALEGAVYGLILGPLTGALTVFLLENGQTWLVLPTIAAELPALLAPDLVASIGAGIFEEALFRLVLLSLLALLLGRIAVALGVSAKIGVVLAVVASALVFSWFHHFGATAEPYQANVFLFRALAGVLLGMLFVTRGFAVCVYAHAVYDVHYYLTNP